MGQETLAEKREWLHNQLNGAIAIAVLATCFVSFRFVGLGILNWKKKKLIGVSLWEDVLILASLIAFLPLCACAIGQDPHPNGSVAQIDQQQWTRRPILPFTLPTERNRTESPYSKPATASVSLTR